MHGDEYNKSPWRKGTPRLLKYITYRLTLPSSTDTYHTRHSGPHMFSTFTLVMKPVRDTHTVCLGYLPGLLAIYLVFLYLLHAQPFTRFQGPLRKRKDNSQRTWLIPRERFMMLHTFHFSQFFSVHFSRFMTLSTFHYDVSRAPFSTGVSVA